MSVPAHATDFTLHTHVSPIPREYDTEGSEEVEGTLVLRDSPWDPLTSLLPMREQLESYLWWPTFLDREMTLAGKLDPQAFLPFTDTISGSRWPGTNGGPKRG